MFLEIQDLTIKYDDFVAVDSFDLSVVEGNFVCLLGPSGCGKTSLLRCIGGFVQQAAGEIYLEKERLDMPAEQRPIATVFQSYALFPHMNVEENICYGLRLRKVPKDQQKKLLKTMLDRVGLTGYAGKKVQDLSGGEQQRVALARSLIIQPRLLLLDEPLSNLDAKLRVNLRAELKRIQQDFGITTIMVTHDQDEAFELADRIVLMNAGKKVEEGLAADLYDQPHSDFTREFLGESSFYPPENPLRPEDWVFVEEHELALYRDSSMAAKIVRRIFRGAFIYFDCELFETKERIRIMLINTPETYLPDVGSKVFIRAREKTAKRDKP